MPATGARHPRNIPPQSPKPQATMKPAPILPLLARLSAATLLLVALLTPSPARAEPAAPVPSAYELPTQPADLLRLDDEMRAFFAARVRRGASLEDRMDQVAAAILGERGLGFRYENDGIYDVREAFRRRRGNCVTYAMLVVAVAREFRIPAEFNEVPTHPRWSRSGGVVLESRHLNVRVDDGGRCYEIDLKMLESLRVPGATAHPATDARAFASAYSNVGAYRMGASDTAGALALFEIAIRTDPSSAAAWSNLGSTHLILGHPAEARAAFQHALQLNRAAMSALSGLAVLERREGRLDEAARLETRARSYRQRNPYYRYALAREELAAGRTGAARRHLARALAFKDNEPLFLKLMAEIAHREGREREARRWAARLAEHRRAEVASMP